MGIFDSLFHKDKKEDTDSTFGHGCEKPDNKSRSADESNTESLTGSDFPIPVQVSKEDVSNRIQSTLSYTNHLSNVISGINHEVSPWLGHVLNIISRVKDNLPMNCDKCHGVHQKLDQSLMSLEQAIKIMSSLSSNIKLLKDHTMTVLPLNNTIDSWVKVTLLDRVIKEMIHEDNIIINKESLNFQAKHSPMYIAQIIYNLAKNSIDHNQHMLDTLKIKIYGKPDQKILVYQDNGKGIPDELQSTLFRPGITTKDDKPHQHGLGLSACMDYCLMMGATISVRSKPGKTKFYIDFEKTYDKMPSNDEWKYVKECYKEKMKMNEHIESGGHETRF
jgi:signal transduction histidine kinase